MTGDDQCPSSLCGRGSPVPGESATLRTGPEGRFESVGGMGSGDLGRGARSLSETVSSLPHGYLTFALVGFTETSSTSETSGSYFDLLTCRRTRTGPVSVSHEGRVFSRIARRSKDTKRSWGVVFVAVQSRDRWQSKTWDLTISQCADGRFLLLRANSIPFQITPL